MLVQLHIHNYAIIEEIRVDFSSQLNVITGETGAGKSILMGALSLILGDRADTAVLLHRDKKCVVEGVFAVREDERVARVLRELDLEVEEEILLRREIAASGKSRAFVNDTPVTLDQLRQVSSLLVDLHRQFDTLSLSDTGFQLDVLDALAGNSKLLRDYQLAYREWRSAASDLTRLQEQKNSFLKEYDYYKFLADELSQAAFVPDELEDADAELKTLSHSEDIKSGLDQVAEQLSGGEQPIAQQLKAVQHQLGSLSRFHPAIDELNKRLHSAQIEIQDIADELERVNDSVGHDPARIEQLNERTALGYKLLKKHGVKTTNELLALQQSFEERLTAVMNIDDEISRYEKQTKEYYARVADLSASLSERRSMQIEPLQEKVNRLLIQVGMSNARIRVRMDSRDPDPSGADHVEFLFNANHPAGDVKEARFEPIRKVASGGELSRLMLSIKSLVAESMNMPTLIFDEIDTGISGEAARQVGIIMNRLAVNRQVITITHQPQIAGRAHTHLFVFKEITNDKVNTNIRTLTQDERITAIAKMLSGEKPTAAALENAREMVMN